MKKPKQTVITISAAPGSGKTTIAAYIAKTLGEAGFNVTVDDIDLNYPQPLFDYMSPERMTAIKEAVDISIVTQQILKP